MRIRVAICLIAAAGCTGESSRFTAAAANISATGNGPYAMVVCQTNSAGGGDRECNGGTNITSATVLNGALTPPATAFDTATLPVSFTFVHSWNLNYEVNLWNNNGGPARNQGVFTGATFPDVDDKTLFPGANSDPHDMPIALTGYISIPASGSDVVKTFGIGANEGFFFAIQGCDTSTTPCSSTHVYSSSFFESPTPSEIFTYHGLKVTFPKAGGLFPFQLVLYTSDGSTSGDDGFEWAWADGDKTAQLPSFGTSWSNPGGFTLVPRTSVFAPDVHAALVVSPLGATVTGTSSLTYTATIVNRGLSAAFPATADAGLRYTLALPLTRFAAPTSVAVNGSPVTVNATLTAGHYTLTANTTNTLVTVFVSSPGASDGSILPSSQPNSTASVAVTATLAAVSNGTKVQVQGRLTGHGVNPSTVIDGQTVAPPETLYVYTNDPTFFTASTAADVGNSPALLATIAGTSLAITGADDSATAVTVNTSTVGAPAINTFASNKVSTFTKTSVAGTVPGGSGTTPLRITLAGVLQAADCTSTGAGSNWAWDAAAGICACSTTAAGGNWSCNAIALKDCAGGASCYTVTATIHDSTDDGPSATYAFAALPPVATVTSPADGSMPATHSFHPGGSAILMQGGTAAANATVTATITGPSSFSQSCSATANGSGVWACAPAILVPADGSYQVSAQVTEANTLLSAAGPTNNFSVDTHPTITAPGGGVTNSSKPTFAGTRIGDGPQVAVCLAANSATCIASAVCTTASVTVTTWAACTPGAAIASGNYLAVEVDAGGNASSPSAVFALVINSAAPTVTGLPASNVLNNAFGTTVGGACASGETVTAAFQTSGGAAWPLGGLGQAKCTAACASGAWSCSLANIPPSTDTTNLRLVISEVAPDASAAPSTTVSGLTVDTAVPAAVGLSVTPPLITTTSTNPAVSGTGTNGDVVTVNATGVTRTSAHPVTATCSALANATVSGGNWGPCTTWDVLDTVTNVHTVIFPEGNFTVFASQTNESGNGNPQSSPTTGAFKVRTTQATVTNVPASKIFNIATNPYSPAGTCSSNETVTAAFQTGAGAAWPSPGGGQLKCSTVCAASAWSCAMAAFPASTTATGLQIVISETDGSVGPPNFSVTGITVDTSIPADATISAIPAKIGGSAVNPPAVGGTGTTGSKVTVTISGTLSSNGDALSATCTTPASIGVAGGAWSCTAWDVLDTATGTHYTAGFPDGSYLLSASETSASGNPQSGAAAMAGFQVKFTPPAVPTVRVSAIVGGSSANPPPVSGTGEANDSLTVSVKSGASVSATCMTTVSNAGSWSCSSWTPSAALADGSYTASAAQTDAFGNVSAAGTQTFLVDFHAPAAPVVSVPSAPAGFTPSRTPSLAAVPQKDGGSVTIVVKSGSTVVGSCSQPVASPAAPVSCAITAALPDGPYAVSATQTDPAGNVSPTGTAAFAVDGTTPLAPMLAPMSSPTLVHQPAFSGSGYPGSTVTVTDQNGNPICTATVSTTPGLYAWTCSPAAPLEDQDYTFTATGGAPNGSGNSAPVSVQIRSFPAPNLSGPGSTLVVRPVLHISGGAAGQTALVREGGSLACFAAADSAGLADCSASGWLFSLAPGDHLFVAEMIDGANPPHRSLPSAPLAVAILPTPPTLAVAGTFGTNQPLLQGAGGTPGSAVTISSSSGPVCAATVPPDGSLSCQVSGTTTLPDGLDMLTITAVAGGKLWSSPSSIRIKATPDMAPLTTPTRDARPQLCVAPQPFVPAGTVAVVLDGFDPLCSVSLTAGAQQGCCQPAQPLADGAHTLMARLHFPPGGSSALSAPFTVAIKTRTATPVLFVAEGDTLPAPVALQGTAEPRATVVVTIDDQALPPATVEASGNFTVDAGKLDTGIHLALAVATDSLGNQAASDPRHFVVTAGGHVQGGALGCGSAGASGWTLLLPLLALLWRRRRAAVAALVLGAAAARADDLGLDHFRPASASDGAIGTEGARPPLEGEPPLELHLWGVGQNRPLVFVPDSGGPSTALIRNRVGGWAEAQLHLTGPLSAALAVPFLVGQHGDLSSLPPNLTQGENLGGGFGDLRATARLAILRQERALFDLAAQASLELPTAKEGAFLGDQSAHGEALAAAGRRVDLKRGALDVLGNLYLRVQRARQVMDVKAGSELGLRGAVAWLPGSLSRFAPRRVLLELEGESFVRAGFARGSVPAEWRAGVEYCLGPVAFDLGAGSGLSKGIGAPGFRIVGGVGLAPASCGSSIARLLRPQMPAAEAVRPPAPVKAAPPPPPASPPKETARLLELPAPPLVTAPPPAPAPAEPPKSVVSEPPLLLPELPLVPLPAKPAPKPKPKRRTVAQAPALELVPLAPPRLATLDGERITLSRPLVFEGSSLPKASRAVLDDVVRLLREHPEVKTLRIAAPDRAQAEAIAASLRKKGVPAARLQIEPLPSTRVELRIVRR